MSEPRTPPPVLGLGLKGSWIELVDPSQDAEALEQLRVLERQERLMPAMGAGGRSGLGPYAPPMVVRSLRDQAAIGVVENHALPGGVAAYVIYLDPRSRVGFGLEATALYVSLLFDAGVRLVTADVFEFNTAVIRMLRSAHLEPHARLREHAYAAGRFWDVLVFYLDLDGWKRFLKRHERRLPGGDRRPVALGSRAPEGDARAGG